MSSLTFGAELCSSPQYAVLAVGRNPLIPATSALPGAAKPVAIASAQNQDLESNMAAVLAEVLNVAASSAGTSGSPMRGMDLAGMLMAVQGNRASRIDTQQFALRDDTTHIVMSPLEFMQRLAALVAGSYLLAFTS